MEKPVQPVILDSTPEIMEFDTAFSLHDIKLVKSKILLTRKEIMHNIKDLKVKLRGSSLQLAGDLRLELEEMSVPNLTWKDLIASKVISDDSELVQKLTGQAHQNS
nr:11084_t:CDS:2 [Entrophospora candida]